MFTNADAFLIGTSLEGFLYGFYTGIFVIYLKCPTNKSRTATIVFYALCLLYVLSTLTLIGDIIDFIYDMRIRSLQVQIETTMMFCLSIVQTTASGSCDFLAQCILIYRCWIVWGQNIYVVIIPSLMALAYFATYLAADGANIYVNNQLDLTPWGQAVTTTSFVLSMAVSTLVTGLIVFKILKVFLEVKAASNSVNRTTSLGSSSSCSTAGGNKLQHVVFVIIESGMALFIIQLIRVVFVSLEAPSNVFNILIAINNMFNGITPTIILVRVSIKLSFEDKDSFVKATESLRLNYRQDDSNTPRQTGSSSSSAQEMSEASEGY